MLVLYAGLVASLRIFVLIFPFDEVVAPVAAGRDIPGNEGEAASPHPELGVFLILDHAGHTLSSGTIDHDEVALEFGAALGHEHADRVGALPAAGVEYGNRGE